MNRTQTALKIREQFDGFMGIVSPHFSKPISKFLNQMVFGLQSAKDIKLSNVARALDEPIALKKTEERLSRNLKAEGLDEQLNTIIAREGASRIGRDTLIIVDPTDIRKQYAEKMPYLATIHDGSSGELATGYSGCMAVACEPRSRTITPLHLRLWSSEAPDFVSENHQVLEVMRIIDKAAKGRGIFVYDRGGDRKTIMHELLDQGSRMIIRQVGNRHVLFNGKPREELEVAEGCAMKYAETIVKETRKGEKVYQLEFGMRRVKLPSRDELMALVVVRGFGKKPLMLLTNVEVKSSRKSIWRIVEAYISRWLVEEAIRFMKQTYNLEDIRLLDWQRLKNIMGILLVALYFLSVHLGAGLRLAILAGHIVTASKRFYGVTEFCYYALADGVGALLSRISPKKETPPPKKSQQDLLPGFS
ncbi:transposase [Pontiellaceae bacterium B1224]|nr:transposase [Pontiellaceae bacterium B1224]